MTRNTQASPPRVNESIREKRAIQGLNRRSLKREIRNPEPIQELLKNSKQNDINERRCENVSISQGSIVFNCNMSAGNSIKLLRRSR